LNSRSSAANTPRRIKTALMEEHMSKVEIYHNPRCSKSRKTLELLKDKGLEPEVIEYLKTPPAAKTLEKLLDQLGMTPIELMRTRESIFKELKLGGGDVSDEQLVGAMVAHPVLIERPIVVSGGKARLGRPPEQVLEIL
jgi:arsenate reductase